MKKQIKKVTDKNSKKIINRREYKLDKLEIRDCPDDPIQLFNDWFQLAEKKIIDYNAFVIATSDENGFPSARNVLLKQHDEEGFIFFTNYDSKKGRDLEKNPNACFLFSWLPLEKQIKINGKIIKTSKEESKEYFNSRPIESKMAASLSKQSEVIENRYRFISEITISLKNKNKKIECPKNWGGYKLIPNYFEFWQGRENRIHDRVIYEKNKDENHWKKYLLYP